MGRECVEFMRGAVSTLILKLSSADKLRHAGVFHAFSRVLIQDSTQIRLPEHLANYFPGPTNQKRKVGAALKIQVVYNLLDETFAHFGLSGFRRTDQAASADILSVAQSGDLVLRDLGYFSTPIFQKLIDRGIHFLSRLRQNVAILDPHSLRRIDLLKKLRTHGLFDQEILLGAEQKVQLRLVALPVPEQIANERRRRAKTHRDRRRNPSKEDLELLGWNIFVTSIESSIWCPEIVQKVYGVRWRIEIIFKSWKSHFNLTITATGSADQVEALIWAKLFAICLFQKLFEMFDSYTPKPISLLKSAQFFSLLLLSSLKDYITTGLNTRIIDTYLRLEKRKINRHFSVPRLLS
jgi:Transposase DDE domain